MMAQGIRAGGLVLAEGPPALAFPRAEHVIGEACLDHAASPDEKDSGSFRPADLELLLRHGKLRRWREGALGSSTVRRSVAARS